MRKFGIVKTLHCALWQKVFRVNSKVYWPVSSTSIFKAPHKIIRGNRFPGLSKYCYIDARNGVGFGDNVWVGPYVSIISMNHDLNDYTKYIETDSIQIGDNCWLGAKSTILPGVKLGNHVVVAANSVVTKSFKEDNIVIAGNPAKVVKSLPAYGSLS
ncbi:acyltransferase [Ekhidna sp. MALMAid0563]|uniref:acyltransferase n=1 Tax=Ekhidna sp. MALMAid0563 TaxID=3143937 RepID=UPI0032E00C4A